MARTGLRLSAAMLAGALAGLAAPAPARAAPCQSDGPFAAWLADFRAEAAAAGLSQRTLALALDGLTFDPQIVAKDRRQGTFRQSFEQFSGRMINGYRLKKGGTLLLQYASVLDRIEQRFGVPGPVVVAIWGLETDFGANRGTLPVIRSVASLAYDCRRADFFRGQLLDALRIVERGDLAPEEMRGAWAGEMGQTQFMPTSYVRYAVDFDGNGRADLIRSVPDVLASTANFLRGHGWQAGGSWQPGTANFEALRQWNKAEVYARTVALFASRLADGSP